MSVAAFLDANVLYPATLRSVMMELALAGAFRPLWSQRVHDEWTNALQRDRPDLAPAKIMRTRALMLAHVDDAMVTGYEHLIDTLTLPDVRVSRRMCRDGKIGAQQAGRELGDLS